MEDDYLIQGFPLESSGKQRIRWTRELHNLFEEAINQLGGPDRATPKGIFNAMSLPGLTLAHVKSHLQKYRMSYVNPDSFDGGRIESRKMSEVLPNFSVTSALQIVEALQKHMALQWTLHNQLEAQKRLKIRIELQGRYLEKITDEHCDLSTCCRTSMSSASNPRKYGSSSETLSTSSRRVTYQQEKYKSWNCKCETVHWMSNGAGSSSDDRCECTGMSRNSGVSQARKRLRAAEDEFLASVGASPTRFQSRQQQL